MISFPDSINKKHPLPAEPTHIKDVQSVTLNHSSPDSQPQQVLLSKRIACIECRQQKVRCDAHQNYPNPCTRCTKKSIQCVLQPDFKRTYKRRRLVEVEKENELLRQSIGLTSSKTSLGNSLLDSRKTDTSSSAKSGLLPKSIGSNNALSHEPESQRRMVSAGSLLDLSNSSSSPSSSVSSSQYMNRHINESASPTDPSSPTSLPILPSASPKPAGKHSDQPSNNQFTKNIPDLTEPSTSYRLSKNGPLDTKSIQSSPYQDLPPTKYIKKEQHNKGTQPSTYNCSSATTEWQDYENGTWKCLQKSMEGVTLIPSTISNLFNEFVSNYHPILPVVDITRGPEKIYQLSPSLFWTIMTVASRRYDRDGKLMQKLTPLLKTCLSEITISPVTRFAPGDCPKPFLNVASVYTVQAFLIFTMWPSITSSLSADSSWNTAGLAMYSAIRVGLHCPGYARDFGRIKADNPSYPKISEQVRTWVCCNIVSQTVATVYGFPAFTSFDASVMAACHSRSSVDVPDTIKQLMLVEYLEDEIAKTLNSNSKDPHGLSELSERLSLIQILSRKLDELELRLGNMDDLRKFVLLGARVHLLTYYFLDNGHYSEIQLQKGIVQVYNSALAIMEHADAANRRNRTFFKYLPGIYVQILWQSTTIICKVYHSSFSKFVDAEAGRVLYLSCVSLISKASIFKHDMMYRASEIMQQVWRLYGSLARRNAVTSRVRIRTRMAASVFFDTLWTMREECGIRSVAPAILNQRNSEGEDEEDEKQHDENGKNFDIDITETLDIDATDGGLKNGKATKRKRRQKNVKADKTSKGQPNNTLPKDNLSKLKNELAIPPTDQHDTLKLSKKPLKDSNTTNHTPEPVSISGFKNLMNPSYSLLPSIGMDMKFDSSVPKGQQPSISSLLSTSVTSPNFDASHTATGPAMAHTPTTDHHAFTENTLGSGKSAGSIATSTSGTRTIGPGGSGNPLDDLFLSFDTDLCLRDVEMLMSDFGFRDDEAFQTLSDDFDAAVTPSGQGTHTLTHQDIVLQNKNLLDVNGYHNESSFENVF